MKKYLIDKNNKSFLKEYHVVEDKINLVLGDNSLKQIENSEENINYLDELMLEQFYEYEIDKVLSGSLSATITSLGVTAASGLLMTQEGIANGLELGNSAKMGALIGVGAGTVTYYLMATAKAKEAEEDYEKDLMFVENMQQIKLYLSSDNFCKELSKKLQEKLAKIKEENISLNTMNDFKLGEIKEIVLKIDHHNCKNDSFIESNTSNKKVKTRK